MVTVADVDAVATAQIVAATGCRAVPPESILEMTCDILAPCALGGVLSAHTIPRLRCAAIVGSANNQLETPDDANRLAVRGILYAPDFVVNAGGPINIAVEMDGYSAARAADLVTGIGEDTETVLATAKSRGITPQEVAADMVAARLTPMPAPA